MQRPTVRSDGSKHLLRFTYYHSKGEYRVLWLRGLLAGLGSPTVGDTFTLEADTTQTIRAYIRRPNRAWLLMGSGQDREYGGNDGYRDLPDSEYRWDSTVPHYRDLQVGDRVVLLDKRQLLGFSMIEEIVSESASKLLHRCPACRKARIKSRRTIVPRYKCQACLHEFNHPITETKDVILFRSRHDGSWVEGKGVLAGTELRRLCSSPESQHSMREFQWERFVALLTEKGFDPVKSSGVVYG